MLNSPPLLSEAVGLTKRPYQTEGINWLWANKRGMLTDAPGLGKTPQAALAAEIPAIVVCPSYLVIQWGEWLKEHFPKRKIVAARGTREEKLNAILNPADFLVVNKEMLRTHMAELIIVATRYHYKTVIFDESHHLRNNKAKLAEGAVELARRVPRVYELTATPIWKEMDDLFMQLRILEPDIFTSYNTFVESFCRYDDSRFGRKVYGVRKDMQPELESILGDLRLGRTYEQAQRDLPPVIENVVKIPLEPLLRQRYDKAVATYRLELQDHPDMIFATYMEIMHTLRQLTWFEKIEPMKEVIADSESYHENKWVTFCWYKESVASLAEQFPEAIAITGDMPPLERTKRAKLQKPIIATISSLSEGVDLSWARMVNFAEEHWPPGSQVQSLMRVRRERQTNTSFPVDEDKLSEWDRIAIRLDARLANEAPILVNYFMCERTIDETIHKTARARSASVKEVMSEALGIYL